MAYLRSFGKYVPKRVLRNDELGPILGAEPEWIFAMSGIEERRWAGEDESVVSMAVEAGQNALAAAGVAAGELGVILVSSGTWERRFPGPAVQVQHALGAAQAVALDVPIASAGALFGLAQGALWTERSEFVLVVASEKMSSTVLIPPVEQGTAMLFGDGAGAAVLGKHGGKARIRDFELCSDGASASELCLEFGQSLTMNGRAVILHAARKVPAVVQTLLTRNGLSAQAVPNFLMHQANANLIAKIAQGLGVEAMRFYTNIHRYGNTSSASLLIAAAEWEEEVGFEAGAPTVLAAFGAGFNWGAMLVEGC